MLIDMLRFRFAMVRQPRDQSGLFEARPRDFVRIATNNEPTQTVSGQPSALARRSRPRLNLLPPDGNHG
jgi:hypothetical protein